MGTTTEGMEDWVRTGQNIATLQDQVDSSRRHAVVAWVGYETPPVPVEGGGFDVLGTELAERGGRTLAADLAALEVTRPGAEVNVVAHSYGTTTASFALSQGSVQIDAFVTLGSAGLPPELDHAEKLNAEHVFAGQAQDVWAIDPAGGDQWAWTGRASSAHPVNPVDPQFGAQAFSVAGEGAQLPVTDHAVSTAAGTGYLDLRTESLRNVALATTGRGDQVSSYVMPGPTPFQRAIIEGSTRG